MSSACFAVGQGIETRGKPGVVVAVRQPYYDVKMTETQQIKTNQHYAFLQAKMAPSVCQPFSSVDSKAVAVVQDTDGPASQVKPTQAVYGTTHEFQSPSQPLRPVLTAASATLSSKIQAACAGLGMEVIREQEAIQYDEAALRRLLVARQLKLKEATTLGVQCCKWRAKFQPDAIRPTDVPTAFKQGTWRFMGFAKNGMPVLLVRACLWDPHKYTVDEYVKYVAYFMEQNIKRAESKKSTDRASDTKNFIIFDFKNMSYFKVGPPLSV
jgi:hypothetical protein